MVNLQKYSDNGKNDTTDCAANQENSSEIDEMKNNIYNKKKKMKRISVEGFKIGTCEDLEALTGVSVIIAEDGAKAGVDVRGCAPGTRETDLLKSEKTIDTVHAVVLSGGSAYGLEASSGVMNYLEEQDLGFAIGSVKVPLVCSAVVFDLLIGDSKIRPDLRMGRTAAENASTEIETGNIGAGAGATVGKFAYPFNVMKGGSGYSEITLDNGLKVGAYVIVNACGEVFDKETVLAGSFDREKKEILEYESYILNKYNQINSKPYNSVEGTLKNDNLSDRDISKLQEEEFNKSKLKGQNTTIGCIITNAELSKVDCNNVSKTAHNGLALSIRPVHTSMDGDTIFTMASGLIKADIDEVCYLAQKVMRDAVIDAVKSAESAGGILSYRDIR